MCVCVCVQGPVNLVSQEQFFKPSDLDLFGVTTALKTAAHDPRIRGVLMDITVEDMSIATLMEVTVQ